MIEYFFAALWAFVMQLAVFVLLLWIVVQALRSLFDGFRR